MPICAGKVVLVGAGPGDPGLISWLGVQWLQRADLILYDYLVNAEILKHASEKSEKICLGRHGRSSIWSQQKINETLVREAHSGKTVIRLKSGDPMIFGRAADELDDLISHDIPFEIVPGITAALASGSYGGIPITHRDHASAVALVTGREGSGKQESSLDFEALAKFPGTLVMYMGVTTAQKWTSGLIAAGKSPETPVALIRRCSWPNQETVRCKLSEVADAVTPYSKFPPPAIAVVGDVANSSRQLAWFEQRPLFGQRVLVTRPKQQSAGLCELLSRQGADTISAPAIQISDPSDWGSVDKCLHQLEQFDWIVFSSANGVEQTMKRLFELDYDCRSLAGTKIAAIGPMTSKKLTEYGLRSDLEPEEFQAEALAESLVPIADQKRFLLARASRGREILFEKLTAAGGCVEQMVVYSSTDTESPGVEVLEKIRNGEIDWITVTSSAIARSVARLYGRHLNNIKIASISPITTATLRELGYEPSCEATTYTMQGVVDAMVQLTTGN